MILKLEDLNVYNLAMEIGEDVWEMVNNWSAFEKDTLGKQVTRSADSIALNIAEGYGRYHFKENKNFCFFSRGSTFETKSSITKAKNKNLIQDEKFIALMQKLERLHKLLNAYIKSIGTNKSTKE